MNKINIKPDAKIQHFFIRQNYKHIEEKKLRLKAYNHNYYLEKNKCKKDKSLAYYHKNKFLIKQQVLSRQATLPKEFKKIIKEVNIKFD